MNPGLKVDGMMFFMMVFEMIYDLATAGHWRR